MRPLDEETLRGHLERRVRSSQITTDERDVILGALGAERTTRHGRNPSALTFGRWFGAAAAAVGLILVVAVVVKPPRDLGSASSPPSGISATSAPAASVGPTNEAPTTPARTPTAAAPQLEVLDVAELVRFANDPRTDGDIAVARARLDADNLPEQFGSFEDCPPGDTCPAAVVAETEPPMLALAGWRRSGTMGTLVPADDGSGSHWGQRLTIPTDTGLFAFRSFGNGRVEYLGPVAANAGDLIWTVPEILAGNHDTADDAVFVVTGWLVMTPSISCPAPEQLSEPGADTEYWCGGSFITARKVYTRSGDTIELNPTGLHVEWNVYAEQFPDAGYDAERGVEPQLRSYLVRSAGCPPAVMGVCPVWSMVGRLDDFPRPAAVSSIPLEIEGEVVLTGDAIPAHIATAEDYTAFLIGGRIKYVQADCFVPDDFPRTPLLVPCDDNYVIDYGSGSFHLVLPDGPLPGFQDGPAVLRVHVHDARAADCPSAYRDRCEAAVVVEEVAWPLLATPEPAPTGVVIDAPTLAVGNWTTLRVFVYVNGMDAAILDPGETVDPITPGMLPKLPWHVEATTSSGRVILTLTVHEGDVWHSGLDPSGGSTVHGAAARAELSCGRLDIWSGPPLGGPVPPWSFPPGDCDP